MFAPSSPCEDVAVTACQPRVQGGVCVSFRGGGGCTRLGDCLERDGYKVRFPKTGAELEGVIINTGGGVAGGDNVHHDITLDNGARATLTTQAAERIYRSGGAASCIQVSIRLQADASLAWLPQETIFYDKANLARRFEIDMAADASLLLAEITVFGRKEMGETVSQGSFVDRWRVRRGERLAFAESIRFESDLDAALKRPAIGNGARVCGTILYVAGTAEERLEAVRASLAGGASRLAASAWNGLLCIRCLGGDLEAVRHDFSRIITVLRQRPMPRVWWT